MAEPNFFIIGAQKCGTEALYDALSQHPDIFMSPSKEPFFFALDGCLPTYRIPHAGYRDRLVYDWERYLALFEGAQSERAIGEASAIYLSSYFPEKTAVRIKQRIPHARIIALIRQPAERAWSAFNFYRSRQLEPLTEFQDALTQESQRIEDGECPDIFHFRNGLYYSNLKPYFDVFPREQIRVYRFEDWQTHPGKTLRDIFDFLGVATDVQIDVKRLNVGQGFRLEWLRKLLLAHNLQPTRTAKIMSKLLPAVVCNGILAWNRAPKKPLAPEIKKELTECYREDIQHLQILIRQDLSAWLNDTYMLDIT